MPLQMHLKLLSAIGSHVCWGLDGGHTAINRHIARFRFNSSKPSDAYMDMRQQNGPLLVHIMPVVHSTPFSDSMLTHRHLDSSEYT